VGCNAMVWGTGVVNERKFLELLDWIMSYEPSAEFVKLFAGANEPVKELSEALTVFKRIYDDTRTRTRDTIVLEVCSGSRAPVAVLTALFIKRGRGWATDICDMDPRVVELSNRLGEKLKLFPRISIHSRRFVELMKLARESCEYLIVVAIHICKMMAVRVLEVFKKIGGDRLILVPCCAKPSWAKMSVGVEIHSYWDWVYALWKYAYEKLGLPARVELEDAMLSEANAIIDVDMEIAAKESKVLEYSYEQPTVDAEIAER